MYILSFVLQIFLLIFGSYYFLISVFAWFKRKEKEPVTDKTHTYALIIAAHNEEAVIEHMVESLNQLNYPRESYDIFVIADNCTDATASLAEAAGAIVCRREDAENRGKGHALEWMFKRLFEMEKQYDSVAVFDADNIVHPDFLMHMNHRQQQGYEVVQGYIDSKNPFDSWITAAYTISFWCVNKLFQYSRYNLNLSCQLCGTGFVIKTDVLKKIGWQAMCLTEDMEFTMKLVLNDYSVSYSNDAVVYDEKPLTFSQSWHQRTRWMQGHADVASRFIKPLLKKAVKDKKWAPVDCALYLLQPVRIIVMGFITFMCWLQSVYPTGDLGVYQVSYLFPTPTLWFVFISVQFAYTPLIIWIEKKQFSVKLLFSYMTYYFYTLTWVPITIVGVINKNKKEWFHTKHTRKISIKDVN